MKLFAALFALLLVHQPQKMAENLKQEVKKQNITVTVANVKSEKGTVGFALYDKMTFMKIPLKTATGTIKKGKSTVVFKDVIPGDYAIICFHDVNGNKQMDFNERGMPEEDYGISNNPSNFGPPNYETAKFEIADKNVTLEIRF